MTIRVELPANLVRLAHLSSPVVSLELEQGTQRGMMEALELALPALAGTVRDYSTGSRRAYLRFFACGEDLSFCGVDEALPAAVLEGREAVLIIGAVSGG